MGLAPLGLAPLIIIIIITIIVIVIVIIILTIKIILTTTTTIIIFNFTLQIESVRPKFLESGSPNNNNNIKLV